MYWCMTFVSPSRPTNVATETAKMPRMPLPMDGRLFAASRQTLIDQLGYLLERFAPSAPITDFFQWAGSSENPQMDAWLDLCGVNATVHLATELLGDSADQATPMSAYQVFETLLERISGPASRALIEASNYATLECLANPQATAVALLQDAITLAAGASVFQASREAVRFRLIAEQYVRLTARATLEAIDGSVWSLLVVRAESCRLAAESVRDRKIGEMLRQGLQDRFRGEASDSMTPVSRRVTSDRDSRQSFAVLGYYAAILEGALRPETLSGLADDTTFQEALETASQMIRLLNEIGTPLLTSDWARSQFARLLDQKTVTCEGDLASVLLAGRGQLGDWGARICQDIDRGGRNLCLTGLLHLRSTVAIPRICDRIDFLAGAYANHRRYLDRLAQDITVQVWNEGLRKIIIGFVEFYERTLAGSSTTTATIKIPAVT